MILLADISSVLFLQDYNTRLVILSTTLLGIAAGVVGCFLLLRRRALMGDALAHATLPGVALVFMVGVALGFEGRSFALLMVGAALTGLLGCLTVLFIRNHSKIRDDAAMGIVLSVFFGFGIVLLSIIQNMPQAGAAGLSTFIYGKTASLLLLDFQILVGVALLSLSITALLFKEFRILCFNEEYAEFLGWPVKRMDVLLVALITLVTVAGLQAVGLILVLAFLIIPAAAARFWTDRLRTMLVVAAVIGGMSGWLGSALSAFAPNLPAGAIIVLVATSSFAVSFCFGSSRGLVVSHFRQKQLAPEANTLKTKGGKM